MPRDFPATPGTHYLAATLHWTLLLSPPADGVTNMARDEAMLQSVRELDRGTSPRGVLRIYGWSHPVLSLGRHQKARGVYSPESATDLGIGIVRRPTGGRAVLHSREITYAAAAPVLAGSTLRDAASLVDRLLLAALARLGVSAAIANPQSRAPAPEAAPCFALPVRGELLANERKLVGSAQWRDEHAWLQHGSILVEDDQALIERVAYDPAGQSSGTLATLHEILGKTVSTAEFHAALRSVIEESEPVDSVQGVPDTYIAASTESESALSARLDELAEPLMDRYRSDEWTWRR